MIGQLGVGLITHYKGRDFSERGCDFDDFDGLSHSDWVGRYASVAYPRTREERSERYN